MAILIILGVVLAIFCVIRESKTTGLYKTFGVYGRFFAYMSAFAPMGLIMFIASFFMESAGAERWGYLGAFAFGAIFYVIAFLKCPDFLKKGLIPSLLISSIGVCIKVCIFFLGFVWKITGPKEVVDDNGNVLYVYGGDVYTGSGELVGKASADRTSFTPNSNYHK